MNKMIQRMMCAVGNSMNKKKSAAVKVWAGTAGFSLIELLVVIGIIAMTMGVSISFMGDTFGTDIKKETRHLAAVIQFAYNESITKSVTHRLVFDLSDQVYWLEIGGEKSTVDAADLAPPEDKPKDQDESKTPEGEAPPPVEAFADASSNVVRRVKLDDTVLLRDVFVAHQKELVVEGRAFLYFFPTGLTEMAVIHLSNEDQTRNYSVIVNPVTGNTRIEGEYIEHDSLFEK